MLRGADAERFLVFEALGAWIVRQMCLRFAELRGAGNAKRSQEIVWENAAGADNDLIVGYFDRALR